MDQQDVGTTQTRRRSRSSSETSVPADVPIAVLEEGSWTGAYFRGLVRGALRKIYFRWPARNIALHRVRVEQPGTTRTGAPTKRPSVFYRCEQCGVLGKAQISKSNPKGYIRVWVDHKDPVVPLDRYPDWREYIERLFCSPDNFEVLCDDCHHTKTQAERRQRKENAKRRKDTPEAPTD